MKKKNSMMKLSLAAAVALSTITIPSAFPVSAQGETADSIVKLRLLETTDIHTFITDYDYYSDSAKETFGFSRTASLIDKMKAEAKNSILVDNGDLLQGNPLGEYMAKVKGLKEGDIHPVYKAMNQMGYDAATYGNHEFNYGLDFLNEATDDANFSYVNANVYRADGDQNADNDQNYFTPYKIAEKKVTDENGTEQTIKIGYIGFVPPQINTWDKANLDGKVITKDIVKSAQKFIPEMKQKGADLIVVLSHSGLDLAAQGDGAENAVFDLATKVPDIDAIVSGHQHNMFPGDARYSNVDKIDNKKGTVNGVPVVMPKNWGSHLGLIDMTISKVNGKWEVTDSQSTASPIYDSAAKKSLAAPKKEIVDAVKEEHEGTLEYVRKEVGQTSAPINSFFALVKDDPSIQIVNDAQRWYASAKLKGTENEKLPLLSAAAPFKAGGRNGSGYFTNIPKGKLAIKNIGDLYLYDNTLQVVKLKGSDVKEWLEMSAGAFNQIDPSKTEDQAILNPEFASFNYDVIDGVTYQIDVTKPAKYAADGKVKNADASRIKNLKYNGKPIDMDQEFLVATNNYRASGGGNFPGVTPDKIVFKAPDENRQALLQYIQSKDILDPSADENWSFAKADAKGKVTFDSSPNAKDFIPSSGAVAYKGEGKDGFASYQLDLSKMKDTEEEPKNEVGEMTVGSIPTGRLIVRQPVDIMKLKEDGTLEKYRTVMKNETIRVYGSNDSWYNVGGMYFVKKSSQTAEYTGRVLIKKDMKLYSSNGVVYRTLKRGEAIKVYGQDAAKYDVGGGYYVKKSADALYFEGMVTLKTNVPLIKEGSRTIFLKKGQQYRVYGTESNKLLMGGGYAIMHDKTNMSYSKN
ncbi:bifunctional 2',3'-cyclic-nucleotide 2'-phosphodiesterase/3'-nucleotidase [Bacillus sp. FJAT-42376]|uniref:bifunctional 2',3'-cyclic-nucleotide 2'-phosphodiesterase/3'-nucleotidase n=1 Tax=Bacillus sp. FJAT-42376 TaxID=2014076 RepID=UPI000F4F1D34|nr:bifunctional 2',3'-cyclic-nucleotide 2'-phosphodiesterase/3'-nucleotidase [Bacillus sp. FJAT-42376]AZB43493.1 bifunctional 2',3'-cyclic-nucleotide 2'-phosphodiesterase/3'-nucleotidase [Bacillus sp. FJAT-42376]